jgi:hypothetical protein
VGVAALPRPVRGISPSAFYRDYLPALWAAVRDGLPPPPPTVAVRLEVEGEAATLCVGPAGLTVDAPDAPGPLVRCTASRDDFDRAVRELAPALLRALEAALPRLRSVMAAHEARLLPAMRAALQGRPGRLELELHDDAGDVFRARWQLGPEGGPVVQLRLTDELLYRVLREGGTLAALLGAGLEARGEVSWLVQLAAELEHATA